MSFPTPDWVNPYAPAMIAFVVAVIIAMLMNDWLDRRQERRRSARDKPEGPPAE
jgi:hypothetical protein